MASSLNFRDVDHQGKDACDLLTLYTYEHNSLLVFAFCNNSASFCKSLIDHGARLFKKQSSELRGLFLCLYRVSRHYRPDIAMVQQSEPVLTRFDDALEILVAMDDEGQLWQDSYYLKTALRESCADQISLFILRAYHG